MTKELLTYSRQMSLLSCPRAHYYRYELGLQSATDSIALQFGSAWHRAMEARWKGANYDLALAAAVPEGIEFDEANIAVIAGLLAGYYEYYANDPVKEMLPEVEFSHPIKGSHTFDSAGKIDGIGVLSDGRQAMVEHKTTGDSLAEDSDYWLRLRWCGQVMQYIIASRLSGWDIRTVLYDVTRKPSIAPKTISVLDDAGCKIVVDASGARVFKKDGKPRESGDLEKGYTVQTRLETSEEFSSRLAADCKARPEFYFARHSVPILDQDLQEFEVQRTGLAHIILWYRQAQKRVSAPAQAWPRNCNGMTCKACPFAGPCLQNLTIDTEHVPAGFVIGKINSELEGVN